MILISAYFLITGDMKKFLIQHEREFIDNTNNEDASDDNLNTRLLLQWAFHIAKGMQYLARMHIMHGDLAARNILISSDVDNCNSLVAKIADFGLAKNFYGNITYQKSKRKYLPWKWMVSCGLLNILSNIHY